MRLFVAWKLLPQGCVVKWNRYAVPVFSEAGGRVYGGKMKEKE